VIDGLVDEYSTSVAVGHGPTGLAVLTSTSPSKVFVVHAYDWTPTLWFIDASTLARHSMADQSGYLGSYPYKVAVNSVTQRAYVSNWHDRMPIVNASSETFLGWVQKKNYQKSYGIDVSQRSDLVYMATIDTGEVIIFDADQAENDPNYGACHHAPPEPRSLRTLAVNEDTGHVFVASPPDFNKGQSNSQVLVLDEDTLLAWTVDHGGRPSDTTCLWNFGITEEDISIAAIPGPAWVATVDLTEAVSAGEEGIAVNPVTGRVYVTDGPGDQLFVLQDSISSTNISLVTNVAVGDNPQGVDVNPETNRVYVANAGGSTDPYGTVSVVNGATNVVTKTIILGP
jgi:DNA-binding beta-propeller fold protein YncE